MSSSDIPGSTAHNRLAHFPISFFATVMGMMGLTLALHAAEQAFGRGGALSHGVLAVSALLFAVLLALYGLKLLRHPDHVIAEWHHPIRLAFFPTVSISLLLLSVATLGDWPMLARGLWVTGAALQGVLTLSVMSGWIGHRSFQHVHLSPAWFIPAVGNVIVPVAGVQLGYTELSWLFFSGGIVFWIVLLTLVFNRLTFHDPLPGRLQPTLVILIAPPAVAFIAWVRMTGGVDAFAHILLNTGYVFALIVATQAPRILRLPFALPFWALSFPLAALSIASFLYADKAGSAAHKAVGTGVLALLVVVIAALLYRTAVAIRRGEICQPE
ncbi:SLAC1 anion channel family protein [Actibacterium sp. D379-3]